MKKPKMKDKPQKPENDDLDALEIDEILEHCIKKGLIEKTPHGYIFKPEFFESLEIYEE